MRLVVTVKERKFYELLVRIRCSVPGVSEHYSCSDIIGVYTVSIPVVLPFSWNGWYRTGLASANTCFPTFRHFFAATKQFNDAPIDTFTISWSLTSLGPAEVVVLMATIEFQYFVPFFWRDYQ
jgi:hypothetical protein